MSYTNKNFYCIISYDEPRGGPTYVPASSEAEATEMLTSQYGYLKNFKIHKVLDTSTIAPMEVDPRSIEDFDKPETIN